MRLSDILRPDRREGVLSLLGEQARVTAEGMAAFAAWASTGDEAKAQEVRDKEHEADDARHRVLGHLLDSLAAPLDQEDLYLLSEGLDAVLNAAKNIVREAQVLEWRPNADLAAMATAGTEAMTCLCAAMATLHDDHDGALERAKRATKLANAIEHHYRLAFRGVLDRSVTAETLAAIDAYRRTADLGEAIRRVAQRTAYTLVKER